VRVRLALLRPALLCLWAALILSACGSSTSSTSTQSAAPTVVSTAIAHNPKLHGAKVLVDSKGFVLYAFGKDPTNTFHSHCLGGCEASWPPLILSGSAPVASGAALGTQLGAVKRPNGKLQVAYAGHLLYTYALERRPGAALGNGVSSFGGTWHALSPAGTTASR
jgi:predicted lipoprotein with Yx(FWY)xxD motif